MNKRALAFTFGGLILAAAVIIHGASRPPGVEASISPVSASQAPAVQPQTVLEKDPVSTANSTEHVTAFANIGTIPDHTYYLYFYSPDCTACNDGFVSKLEQYVRARDKDLLPIYKVDVSLLSPTEMQILKSDYGVTRIPAVFKFSGGHRELIGVKEIYDPPPGMHLNSFR